MCDPLPVIYECFTYAYMLYVYVWSETGHWRICLFLLAKPLSKLVYLQLLYLMRVPLGLIYWMISNFNSFVNL